MGHPFSMIEWLVWFGTPQLVLWSTNSKITEYFHLKGKSVITGISPFPPL
jgi:hypothetical protein